ncbi:glycosyltransferase family A protein [Nonlabens agnitus]|uniref:Glycosyltransferase 2-like domain-containing protein n=1 Tax=Nonlabens agnitus TaxID=870484 RepID=A0A2S9WU55_9FLAO|nr:glycosyltransferase family 2 protein [Nonlabens agnitus]PRP66997.1 hypothetical protein BST86_07740 [Nonlabens agnitus]
MKLEISVIIPVYNAIRFLEKAVLSAVNQDEVIEVLVIDDGSTDGSYELLQELEQKHHKVKLLLHPEHINKGRSATRNLGITSASGNLIAFLDSDDYFLENRFKNDIHVLNKYPDSDGVYNAVGFEIHDASKSNLSQVQKLYTVNQVVEPDVLFEGLVAGKVGHFQINGLTVKRSLFYKTGLFNEELQVAEDSDIFWKMAMKGRLYTGKIDEAVAIRGVHEYNSFYQVYLYDKYIYTMYDSLISWSSRNKVPLKRIDLLLKAIWILKHKKEEGLVDEIRFWAKQFWGNHRIIFSYLFIKYFPIVRRRKLLFPFLK